MTRDSTPGEDPLVALYEFMRQQVLGSGGRGPGVALLMRRGMAAWLQAWKECVPQPPPLPPTAPRASGPGDLMSELRAVLAGMALQVVRGALY